MVWTSGAFCLWRENIIHVKSTWSRSYETVINTEWIWMARFRAEEVSRTSWMTSHKTARFITSSEISARVEILMAVNLFSEICTHHSKIWKTTCTRRRNDSSSCFRLSAEISVRFIIYCDPASGFAIPCLIRANERHIARARFIFCQLLNHYSLSAPILIS